MNNRYIFILLLFLSEIVSGQEVSERGGIKYYSIDKKYMPSTTALSNFNRSYNSYLTKAYRVDREIGQSNKNKDCTNQMQKLLDQYDILLLPNFPMLINEKGLKVRNNQVILFDHDSKLIMIANGRSHYSVLLLNSVSNVKIFNAKITGDRYEHLNQEGQHGMGIRVFGSDKIEIINPFIEKMWGDGIYIGGPKNSPSRNIVVYNAVLDNNRRNGISITSADGVKIDGGIVANSNGQSPKAGIDIEPNNNDQIINNITINNVVTYHNPIYGISLSLGKIVGESPKNINISINNPIIVGSKFGITMPSLRSGFDRNRVTGKIELNNIFIYRSSNPVKLLSEFEYDLLVNVSGLKIFNRLKDGSYIRNSKVEQKIFQNLKSFKTFSFN
ncbi:right-handed parallel beta-helix repeat-containing protein [Sphingobacterium sp.]|uniref:right-handed parallel beta-helix repeat-containing protein n=1 Tax=Sphingobacterium sp. TaxID=341027 RepID=UPI0028A8A03A|nr:right-handed parallel beta-helix repeat-containing protein [Sphingobacterium sp.]